MSAARAMLEAWPVRVRLDGRPVTLDLKTADRWSSGPVDTLAVQAFRELAK